MIKIKCLKTLSRYLEQKGQVFNLFTCQGNSASQIWASFKLGNINTNATFAAVLWSNWAKERMLEETKAEFERGLRLPDFFSVRLIKPHDSF